MTCFEIRALTARSVVALVAALLLGCSSPVDPNGGESVQSAEPPDQQSEPDRRAPSGPSDEKIAAVSAEAQLEAKQHFDAGQRLMDEGSYADAVREFECVLEIVRWAPLGPELDDYYDRADDAVSICLSRTRAVQSSEIDRMRQIARELEVIHRQRNQSGTLGIATGHVQLQIGARANTQGVPRLSDAPMFQRMAQGYLSRVNTRRDFRGEEIRLSGDDPAFQGDISISEAAQVDSRQQLDDNFRDVMVLLAYGQAPEAIRILENSLEIIRWMRGRVDYPEHEKLARCLLDEAHAQIGTEGAEENNGANRVAAAEPRSNAERYRSMPEREYTAVTDDAQSTFAIDVDTGSYTIARRYLQQKKHLPPAGAIRVEEFLNYFRHDDYAAPTAGEPFAVNLAAAPSPFDDATTILRVGVRGYQPAERPPLNLMFLIDVSGSMESTDKLPLVTYALSRLVRTLRPTDSLGIVVYAGEEAVVLEPTMVTSRSAILDVLGMMNAGGSTNGAGGLRKAYELAAAARSTMPADSVHRVVLCTDGDFNIGATDDELVQMVEAHRDLGIYLSVFVFGRGNINDEWMEQLANRCDGNYAYIDSAAEAVRAMGAKLTGTLHTIARDVKIQVTFGPGVKRYRLIGYENRAIADEDFRNDAVDAGELGAGHQVTAIYELEHEPAAAGAAHLADVALRWKQPQAGTEDPASEIHRTIAVRDVLARINDGPPSLALGVAIMQFARVLRQSANTEPTDLALVADLIATAPGNDVAELRQLVDTARRLYGQPVRDDR